MIACSNVWPQKRSTEILKIRLPVVASCELRKNATTRFEFAIREPVTIKVARCCNSVQPFHVSRGNVRVEVRKARNGSRLRQQVSMG